ncbi:M15 family metallopeptidase [Spirochaeta africana]|uniref:Peptidase M15C domain-containing protein n=1 Tax=Spirochaeta africana (strain ATCC 700263 / DSM 8902 / Z-7692) TaxID=889378 RepID=H9UMI7_SPIAZ|nr:M15 family metallopeptidase [Spirochaeta africana]AFG38730.1 hypothetical protein Spiaf_2705 [Spirochaeta africana DSM 8902]
MNRPALIILLLLLSAATIRGLPDIPADLQRLQHAYPGAFAVLYREGWRVCFPDGPCIPWDAGRRHSSYADLLAEPNLKDMFAQSYQPLSPDTEEYPELQHNHDPGRIRHQGFFQALYGSTREEVETRLRDVEWMPTVSPPGQAQVLRVTTAFGIADRVERISAALEQLPAEYHHFLMPSAGAYYWRTIAGTNRLSMHSFGIAIDINPRYGAYWRWDTPASARTRLPAEIVRIFEREGFIWGGSWYHYDSFHFEYRPELLPAELDN